MRGSNRRRLERSRDPSARAEERPMSTEGPSGPNEAPLPSVMAAAIARSTGAATALACTCPRQAPLHLNQHLWDFAMVYCRGRRLVLRDQGEAGHGLPSTKSYRATPVCMGTSYRWHENGVPMLS